MTLNNLIDAALREDIGSGDHTSLACTDASVIGEAQMLVKQDGVIAGLRVAQAVFRKVDQSFDTRITIADGSVVSRGDVVMYISGRQLSILSAERTALNFVQRMSGIASLTRQFVKAIEGTQARILDTRKTIPGWRELEKEAVRLGGAHNHRMGLHDMILIKDNHIAFCGGISKAIDRVKRYLATNGLNLRIEIETKTIDEVREVLATAGVDRIMLDNFKLDDLRNAITLIGDRFETEASGGIRLENVRAVAETGVDFISIGAITHSAQALDVSIEAS